MTEPLIRPTTAADTLRLPVVERSAAQSFRADPELAWIAEDAVKPRDVHDQRVAEGTSWVAEVGGEPVGFLCAEVVGAELHVWELAVSREHQGRGLGRGLLAAAVAAAGERGLAAVTLTTFLGVPWNEPFYRRCGFDRIRELDAEPRLAAILRHEVAQGLPGERRCAMRLVVGG